MYLSRFFFAAVVSFAALFLFSCKDAPTDIGNAIVQQDKPNYTHFNSDSVKQYSFTFKHVVQLNNYTRMFIGKKDNIKASSLIKFFISLPDTIANSIKADSLVITSSNVALVRNYFYGDSTANIDFNAYEINSAWGSEFTSDSLASLSYGATDLIQSKDLGDSLFSFTLDNSVVKTWLQAAADTNLPDVYGFILKPTENSEKIVGFYPLTTSLTYYPNLQVVVEKPGVYVDTLNFIPFQDLSVVEGTLPTVSQGNLSVQGGLTANSKLWFDVSGIPTDAALSKAELVLKLDTLQTVIGNTKNANILAYSLIDSNNVDSVYSSYLTLSKSGDSLYVSSNTLTAYVNNWIKTGNNQGLLLTTYGQTTGLELFSIKGSNAANIADRPKLRLTYTRLK